MPRGRRLFAKALVLLLGIAVFAPALSTVDATAAHADPGSEEAQFVALTNQLRAQHGLSQLKSYGPLVSIARNWSARMAAAGSISHNMNLPNMVSGPWTKLGENVGVGGAPDVIQQAFINSPHHYENLIDPVWNYVGIGVVDSGGRVWVTVDFMQLDSAPSTTAAPRVVARPTTPASAPEPSTTQAPSSTTTSTTEPPAAPMTPTPALMLALEQVRAADR
ncbi:MAG: CAP domain-containing protein [Acidimicrobiia bacterium]|nr:CAP domain-containing protein [Acidimicrobiia bacterium]MBV8986600.1 CAP domain-containing protein [Acidimicrobiia bacterium]MBV9285846.1 CAP domain-containing protein [Acidimicrobiia bacterium]